MDHDLIMISTLFMALHGEIDSYHAQLLQIKKLNENEGTKQFTKVDTLILNVIVYLEETESCTNPRT
jgi:hypothetical protein